MRLALFDLDHTLIPFDSGFAWTRFLIMRGHLPASAEETYLGYARQYVAGTLDMHAMHRAAMAPLLPHSRAELHTWVTEFEAHVAPRLTADMHALVRQHQAAGDLCAIVTATTRLVAAPFARLFSLPHLVCTEAATVDDLPGSAFTGDILGEPCFRGHKVRHVQQWLARSFTPARALTDFAQSWFYSDSASDLPLLQAVTHPVAVRPDERLRAVARQQGWRVI